MVNVSRILLLKHCEVGRTTEIVKIFNFHKNTKLASKLE